MTNTTTIVSTVRKPVNYLNNKDMLKEIHASKNTWCYFKHADDHRYDLIIDRADEGLEKNMRTLCSKKSIAEARKNRAARLGVTTREVPVTDLVFRVMTWDHIPVAPKQPRKVDKKRSAREIFDFDDDSDLSDLVDLDRDDIVPDINDMVHVRVNFPPFQHFKIDEQGSAYCVGKSHWTGGVVRGHFSKDHGQITNTLAKMYLEMTNRFSTKFNWRGYTYLDEMKGAAVLQLTYVGLRFNEAKSDNPFAYYTAAITNSFCRVLNTEKKNQVIRDDMLEMAGLNPSWSRQQQNIKTE